MNQKNKILSIELLNYEGPVLVAHMVKKRQIFIITDEHKNIIDVLSYKKFIKFLDGEVEVVDSKNRSFNYANAHVDAKPSFNFLEFLKAEIYESLR